MSVSKTYQCQHVLHLEDIGYRWMEFKDEESGEAVVEIAGLHCPKYHRYYLDENQEVVEDLQVEESYYLKSLELPTIHREESGLLQNSDFKSHDLDVFIIKELPCLFLCRRDVEGKCEWTVFHLAQPFVSDESKQELSAHYLDDFAHEFLFILDYDLKSMSVDETSLVSYVSNQNH